MPELSPVRAVITDPAAPLTGVYTHDGVPLGDGDSVLVAQPSSALNGPRTVAAGPWPRRSDFDALAEMVPGAWLTVLEGGADRPGSTWYFQNPLVPAILDVTILNWAMRTRGLVEKPGGGLYESSPGVFAVNDTGVLPGNYTSPSFTVGADGRVESVASGSVPTSFIEGLEVVWNSANSLTVKAGSAWIPGLDRVLDLPTDLTKSGLVLTANTWYYLYLFENAGVGDVEVVTTAPDAPYRGSARIKGTPDDTRRYLGAVRTGAANTMYRFSSKDGFVRWLETTNALPFQVVSGGAATSLAPVSCSAVMPVTSTRFYGRITTTGSTMWLSYSGITAEIAALINNGDSKEIIETNNAQGFQYRNGTTGGSTNVTVYGYYEER